MVNVGDLFPNFEAETVMHSNIKFFDWMEDSWCLFLSHHCAFTAVCSNEFLELVQIWPELAKRNVKIVILSCSPIEDHFRWLLDVTTFGNFKKLLYPHVVVLDKMGDLSVELDILEFKGKSMDKMGMPARATFLIDPKKYVRFSSIHPKTVGRNFNEIIRVIDAVQFTDAHRNVAIPVNWMHGKEVFLQSDMSEDEIRKKYPKAKITSAPSGKLYIIEIPANYI